MADHTLGPWKVDEDGLSIYKPLPGGAILQTSVAIVRDDYAYASDPARPEALANARLIAAAPDLLAALELAESELRPVHWPVDQDDTHDVIRAAIAKAKGEAMR